MPNGARGMSLACDLSWSDDVRTRPCSGTGSSFFDIWYRPQHGTGTSVGTVVGPSAKGRGKYAGANDGLIVWRWRQLR
jgi:hypothetical protein